MFDTDISSYIIKQSNRAVLRRLANVPIGDTCVSVITACELQYGVETSTQPQRSQAALDMYLAYMQVLELAEATTSHYAQIRAFLKSSGQIIGPNDLFIAAHARTLGLVLVTNNIREFGRVPGLKVENWTDASTGA